MKFHTLTLELAGVPRPVTEGSLTFEARLEVS
jgi:hypothetical protein